MYALHEPDLYANKLRETDTDDSTIFILSIGSQTHPYLIKQIYGRVLKFMHLDVQDFNLS
jgi:hypothetical protein